MTVERQTVIFKPLNLEGFDDTLGIDRDLIVKYMDQGDSVKIIECKNFEFTGSIKRAMNEMITLSLVRMDGSI